MGINDTLARTMNKWLGRTTEAPTKTSGGGGATRDPFATVIKRIGLALGVGQNRNEFIPPDFDLSEITTAYDTESYVRQSIDKYIEMMFKAGWDIVGENEAAVEYIKIRLKLMAEMTQFPTDQFFIEVAEDLVKYSNTVIVKARDKQNMIASTGAPVNIQGLDGQAPVAGYFPLNVTTLAVRRDRNGTVRGWEQEVEGEDKPQRYRTEDIVHIYYKREKGRAFGTPFLLAALDDIRALRQAEENVLRLIYRNLNPLLHVQVGTNELPGQQTEIDNAERAWEDMDLEAVFITSERVKVTSVANDQIIDAKEYLKYFEQRVFTGLGVSELMMGRGNTANRSTGDNLSNEFTDRVKAFQKVMAIFVDEFIIKELLMEGGFDPVLNPQDDVDFVFKEIDVDAKIKAENHALFLYEHNAITEDEMRTLIGRDSITDRGMMHMNLVSIPTAVGTAQAKAGGTAATDNRNAPKNQHTPKEQTKDTDFKLLYMENMGRTFEASQEAINKTIESYLDSGDEQFLAELKNVVRYTEEDLAETMQHYLGIDYSKNHTCYVNQVCERLYSEIIELVSTMESSQRKQLIFETVGGLYHVLQMRVADIADSAYQLYIGNKEV